MDEAIRRLTERTELLDQRGKQGAGTHIAPNFAGRADENVDLFVEKFVACADFNMWSAERRSRAIPLHLQGMAYDAYKNLDQETKQTFQGIVDALKNK
jgi:hypothetical protein